MALFRRQPSVPCERYAGLEYHVCVFGRGHAGRCRFVTIDDPPRVHRPDQGTLIRRKLLVWAIADRLHQEQTAHTAWGQLGLAERLDLASHILELVKRNQALDGGLQTQAVIP